MLFSVLKPFLELLKPLIVDVCPQIKQCASIALGRLVHSDAVMAEQLLDAGLLNLLLRNVGTGNVRSCYQFNQKN